MRAQNMAYMGRCWADAGLGEHASVAAFAHLSLHMLNLGAPPRLLLGAIQAMKEEVQHAQLCFGVARKFLGHAVGPGPLQVPDFAAALDDTSSILAAAIVEGCIEETISTQYAREASARCLDHAIETTLGKIIADEARHAELSWQFVAWMLEREPALRPLARSCFLEQLTLRRQAHASEPVGPGNETAFVDGLGILDAASRDAARQTAIETVILPKARQLLDCDFAIG